MAGYSKEFLIDVFVSRYECLGLEAVEQLHELASSFYDKSGKDAFRKYACVDAAAVKLYKETH